MNITALKDFLNQRVELTRRIRDRGEVFAPEENHLWTGHCNVMIRAFKEVLEEIERLEVIDKQLEGTFKIGNGHYFNMLDEMEPPRRSWTAWIERLFK